MARCSLLLMVLALASLRMDGAKAVVYKEINPANIRLRIREESDIINVTWKNPNRNINDQCYESNLQYKSQCDLDWLDFVLLSFNFTLQPFAKGSGRNYTFRVRMKYACLFRNWSAWTAESHWGKGDILGSCFEASTNAHIVIVVIPVIFFLVFLVTQKQIRRLLLPKVPDPKHMYEDLLKIDQSQLEKTFQDRSVECVTLKIEIVHPEKEEEGEEEGEEQSEPPAEAGHTEPTALTRDTTAGKPTCPSNTPAHALARNGYVYW
ncbi:cytokine receptor-like factor 2 [Anguilla anguilla]|uniref:cytokine receptor-like factor 2 n=1 Tax=Anguilla anguilla TaxID=7936 RepID=UPI0015A9C7A7|nr:cytokine receptor-like factor 2 [Anguilla anguilla]